MKVRILLDKNETIEEAQEDLVKAIVSRNDVSKIPHPDPVVQELSIKMQHEYNKMVAAMMREIYELLKYRGMPFGKSKETNE